MRDNKLNYFFCLNFGTKELAKCWKGLYAYIWIL